MPRTLASDTFTYANGALATVSNRKWTKPSGLADITVSTNAVTSAGADAYSAITDWTGSLTSQWAQVTVVTTSSSDNSGGPAVRLDGVSSGYLLHANNTVGPPSGYTLIRLQGGVFTNIATTAGVAVDGDIAYLEIVNSLLRVLVNGVQVISVTDTNLQSGKPGVCGFDNVFRLDNWSAGDFGGGYYQTINNVMRLRAP